MRRFLLATLIAVGLVALSSPLFPSKAMSLPRNTSATITVDGTHSWTDSGIDVSSGNSISITATGLIYMSPGSQGETPDGHTDCIADSSYVAPGLHCWSMIGNIANGTPFQLGSSISLSASASGRLYLGVNDNNFSDNSGSWTATVTVTTFNPSEKADYNWAGYSVSIPNPQFSHTIGAQAAWTVQAVSCINNGKPITGMVADWVGVKGTDIEQDGTASQCTNGSSKYWAWYEIWPQMAPYPIMQDGNYPINAGDNMRADVTDQGSGYFVFRLFDDTKAWAYTKIITFKDTPDTAAWIVEDPGNATGHAAPFPQFYNVVMTNCKWNSNSLISGSGLTRYTLWYTTDTNGNGKPPQLATTLDIFPDGTDFSVYWNHV